MKKLMTPILLLSLTFSAIFPVSNADAATKLTLSSNKLSMKVGATKTVKANKSVTWKSSNKKIATVKKLTAKKAKITAKKAGSCKIKATAGKKTAVIRVTIKKVTNKPKVSVTPTVTTNPAISVTVSNSGITVSPTPSATTVSSVATTTPVPSVTPSDSAETATPEPSVTPTESAATATPKPSVTPTESVETATPKPSAIPTESAKTATPMPSATPSDSTQTASPAPSATVTVSASPEPSATASAEPVTGTAITVSAEGISMTLNSYENGRISYTIENQGIDDVEYSYNHNLEKEVNGEWVPVVPDRIVNIPMVFVPISVGEKAELTTNLKDVYDLEPGNYRFSKTILHRTLKGYVTLCLPFEVTNAMISQSDVTITCNNANNDVITYAIENHSGTSS